MKVIQSQGRLKLAVVCCLHGDEVFGERIFYHYVKRLTRTRGLRLILAHESALARKVRYIEADLNRSFPGRTDGNTEQRLAHELLQHLNDAPLVLDVHTTTSQIKMTPIVANLEPSTKAVINLCDSQEVALMSPRIAQFSLIGNVPNGVSLEFNEQYAKSQRALDEVQKLIRSLLEAETKLPLFRKVYLIDQTMPLSIKLPAEAENFKQPHGLDFYPFLLNEKSYVKHQGFSAKKYLLRKI